MNRERNPDITLPNDSLPDGFTVIEGKMLMTTARSIGIPWGVCYRAVQKLGKKVRPITVGLVLRDEHVATFLEAIDRKLSKS